MVRNQCLSCSFVGSLIIDKTSWLLLIRSLPLSCKVIITLSGNYQICKVFIYNMFSFFTFLVCWHFSLSKISLQEVPVNNNAAHSSWRNYDDFNEYFWSYLPIIIVSFLSHFMSLVLIYGASTGLLLALRWAGR